MMAHDKNPDYAGIWKTPSGRKEIFFLFLNDSNRKGCIEDEVGIADVSEFIIDDRNVAFYKDYIRGGAKRTIYYSGGKSPNERVYSGTYKLKVEAQEGKLVDEIGSFEMEPFLEGSLVMNLMFERVEEKVISLFSE